MAVACPCGSGAAFAACCRPYLRGEAEAPTAEALMRSRYTAYVRRDAGYLARTWHPDTRPVDLGEGLDATEWRGLEILATTGGKDGDDAGSVTFVAHHATGVLSIGQHRETSRFVREGGVWLYVEGDLG